MPSAPVLLRTSSINSGYLGSRVCWLVAAYDGLVMHHGRRTQQPSAEGDIRERTLGMDFIQAWAGWHSPWCLVMRGGVRLLSQPSAR